MLHFHWPLSKECFINTFWASHCKVGSTINSNVCHIFTELALCSIVLVYWMNNYYRSVQNPFIVRFYFLNALSEGRLLHILNGECKGGYHVFIYIIFYHLYEPCIPFCIILHCLMAVFYLPHHPHIHHVLICELSICLCLSWQYFLVWGCVHILNSCFATKNLSYVCGVVPWLDTPAAFWVPTGKWKMKVRGTVLTVLVWRPGGVNYFV